MKNNPLRKLGICAATLSMTAALSFGAFAPALVFAEETDAPVVYSAGENDNSVTVTNVPGEQTFELYQLFTGTFAEDTVIPADLVSGTASAGPVGEKNKMGNASFGSSVMDDGKAIVDAINAFMEGQKGWTAFAIDEDSSISAAQQVIDIIGETSALASTDFSNALLKAIQAAGYKVAATQTSAPAQGSTTSDVTFNNIQSGYYLIGNTSSGSADNPAESKVNTSAILVPVQGAISIYTKSSMPTLDKEVSDTDDDSGWDSASDVGLIKPSEDGTLQINDLKYRLTGTVAKNISDYETYKYTFTDTLPIGVVFNDTDAAQLQSDWNMKYYVVNGTEKTELTTAPTLTITNPGEGAAVTGATLTWTWDDLKKALSDMNIDTSYANAENISIVIEYAPKFTQDQINNIYDHYSSANSPQLNSAFVTFPNNPNTSDQGKTPTDETRVYSFNLKIRKIDKNGDSLSGAEFTLTDAAGNIVGNPLAPDENSQFNWSGLDGDTEYTLTETKVPDGYKQLQPIKFKIVPTFTEGEDGNKVLSAVEVVVTENKNSAFEGNIKGEGGTPSFILDLTTVSGNVKNVPGTSLPVTGQAGIWTGVVAGGAVIAVSAYAILKKKKAAE